jgi:hypothetical protein
MAGAPRATALADQPDRIYLLRASQSAANVYPLDDKLLPHSEKRVGEFALNDAGRKT